MKHFVSITLVTWWESTDWNMWINDVSVGRQCYIRWSADRQGRQEPSVTHPKSVTVAQSEPSCLLYSYAPQWAVLSVLTCSDSAGYPPLRLSVYLGLLLYSLSCKMKVSREIKQMTAHDQGQWPCSLLSTLAGTKTLSRTQSSNMWTLDTHMCENTPVTLSTGLCSSAGSRLIISALQITAVAQVSSKQDKAQAQIWDISI